MRTIRKLKNAWKKKMEWISIKDRLPPVEWSEPDEKGKRYSSDIPVLILREITCPNGKKFNSIVVGELDTGGVPDRWIIGYYTVTEEYGLEFESVEIDDVTHWMPLPSLERDDSVVNCIADFTPKSSGKTGQLNGEVG